MRAVQLLSAAQDLPLTLVSDSVSVTNVLNVSTRHAELWLVPVSSILTPERAWPQRNPIW